MLDVNQLIGFGVGAEPLELEYLGYLKYESTTSGSASISVPAGSSVIAVSIATWQGSQYLDCSAVSLDSDALTLAHRYKSAFSEYGTDVSIWALNTTKTGTLTLAATRTTASAHSHFVRLYRVNKAFASYTPDDTAGVTDGTDPIAITMDDYADGLAIMGGAVFTPISSTFDNIVGGDVSGVGGFYGISAHTQAIVETLNKTWNTSTPVAYASRQVVGAASFRASKFI